DQGATWTALTIAGAADLIGIAYTTHFVAVDSTGNAFTSVDGKTWSAAIATGLANARAMTSTGFSTSPGFGFVVVGTGGVNASSF
ncbi:MAG TPA: hypothetical protein VFR86_09225, partial [Burkholderiaceae bacterium]|nr:hypothetical protein [Burkholderiaceae bacterium]